MKVKNHLPELIKEYEALKGRKVQQQEIAAEAGVTQATLSRYINGPLASLNLDIEHKLCQFFTKKLGREINRGDLFSFDLEKAS